MELIDLSRRQSTTINAEVGERAIDEGGSIIVDAKWRDCAVLVTHNPPSLLANPLHKRAVWQDMLMLQEKRCALSLSV